MLSIEILDNKIGKEFQTFDRRIKVAIMGRANKRIAIEFVKQLKQELLNQGLIDNRELYDSIGYKHIGRGIYTIHMKRYGIALDSMRPHFVSLYPGRRITNWVQRNFEAEDIVGGSIYVRPHPWIDKAFIRAVHNINPILNMEIDRVLVR